MAQLIDILVLSTCAFLGNVGVALTGFGMAIIYLFVLQIFILFGFENDFKFAVFIQALSFFSVQPLLLYKSDIRQHASHKILMYFIPITVMFTPLGQKTSDWISTYVLEAVGGVLITLVACFEMYQKKICCRKANNEEEKSLTLTQHHSNNPLSSFHSKYVLGDKIGEGSFSVVREGRERLSGVSYAIKIIEKSNLLEEEEERLHQEISIMQELQREDVIRLHSVFDEPYAYYLVNEMMGGGDLLEYLEIVSAFNERQGRKICKTVLSAVCYIHSKNIVHRDLKPDNILFSSLSEDAKLKLADFGFAKKETVPNTLTTMCGTLAYVAPEIIGSIPYGTKADLWSVGVISFNILSGYQPFHGNDDNTIRNKIMNCAFKFDDEYWSDISHDAKDVIKSLITLDPASRLSAADALSHSWFSKELQSSTSNSAENEVPVFFMIGSQRSGSNWLRTMLDEREDLAGPHPPHIMRDILPIIDKFGNLSIEDNFRVLVDHVCNFVEHNQVPWTDKNGNPIYFIRNSIYEAAKASCQRILKARDTASGSKNILESSIFLLSVFDSIMNFYTKAKGKSIWICKSMGMCLFHNELLEFYGEKRLRYIYLVRDPRDVALSFMNTPVGDCHYYTIIKKWTKLQSQALHIIATCPKVVFQVKYESILENKASVVKKIYEFIGVRRFGGLVRQASVLCLKPDHELIVGAKNGHEAQVACGLSSQFMNLGRGESFVKNQYAKWRHPETGLNNEELQMIESVAYNIMQELGYETALVGKTTKATSFSEKDISKFTKLNKEGIHKMLETLKKENPDDYERRQKQSRVLTYEPKLIKPWDDPLQISSHQFISDKELQKRSVVEPGKSILIDGVGKIDYSIVTQQGYYPGDHCKPNQDVASSNLVGGKNEENTKENMYMFSVYDGHGSDGHKCSKYASRKISQLFREIIASGKDTKSALEEAHLLTHRQLLSNPNINTSLSGTTATSIILQDDKCVISNVGDSSCILGSSLTGGGLSARLLCKAHTPIREDERKRIKEAGGLVMTLDQRDGLDPIHENWIAGSDQPRVWSGDDNKLPGCGFTRSLGDSTAHTLGVTARPELFDYTFGVNDRILIVASDGLTEFLNESSCINIASSFSDPSEAATALVRQASHRWIEESDYIDDITVIVIFINLNSNKDESKEPTLGPETPVIDTSCTEDTFECNSCAKNLAALEEGLQEIRSENNQSREIIVNGDTKVIRHSEETKPVENTFQNNGPITHDMSFVEKDLLDIYMENIGFRAKFWTLFAGASSGFLGGLCGIRGPPILLYFLYPPSPLSFSNKSQRATGACIAFVNIAMRIIYYVVDTVAFEQKHDFDKNDWNLYLSIFVSSILGVYIGDVLFDLVKESKDTFRTILAFFLLLCGLSLLIPFFKSVLDE